MQRTRVVRLIGEDVAPRRDRGVAIAELLFVELGDAREQRMAIAGIFGPLGLLPRDRAQLGPVLAFFVEARERGAGATDRRRARRVGLEQPAIRLDRVRGRRRPCVS